MESILRQVRLNAGHVPLDTIVRTASQLLSAGLVRIHWLVQLCARHALLVISAAIDVYDHSHVLKANTPFPEELSALLARPAQDVQ